MSIRYLKNNGKPSTRTFPAAHIEAGKNGKEVLIKKKVTYLDEKGRQISYMHDKVDESVTVQDFPHIIDFRYGPVGFPDKEKHINILVGQVVKTSDEKLFDALWKQFRFLDEVDAEGNLLVKNNESIVTPGVKVPEELAMARHLGEKVQ